MVNEYGEIIDGVSWWEDVDSNGSGGGESSTMSKMMQPLTQGMNNNDRMAALQEEEQIGMEEGTNSGVGVVIREVSCEEYKDGVCPIELHLTFRDALRDRAYWLVGLLTL